jgi:hypothetical protein
MAITTNAELESALAGWLDRSDLTVRIPDFVTLCEARVNRKLRVREMQLDADVSLTGGTRTAALPSDFGEVRRLYINSSPVRRLEYISSDDYWDRYLNTNTGKPVAFAIEGSNLVFGPIPDSSYTAKLLYYRKMPAISSTAHGLFTANQDLYLYGSLVSAEPYMKNDKRYGLWEKQFNDILMELESQTSRVGGSMRMRDTYNPY